MDEHVFVAGQIRPEDLPGIKAAGVTAIVNNRPDDEEPDQPSTAEMAVAAQAAGLSYQHIPMAGGLSPALVEEMANALAEAEGPLLAFCRSGTRSTYLWALAEARRGADGEELMRKAAAAGYDLTPIARFL
ncbi:TIGR01244 family sulfur transferase [Allosphingosinicella sp.]|uniref:TIGR01244 family sulfur transferase n=1 Tax=Allosphingosinicella sp. TaxID=2823234 RepID=UPI003D75E5B7